MCNNNENEKMDLNRLLYLLDTQLKSSRIRLSSEVRATMRANEEQSESERIAQEELKKYLHDSPLRGVLSLDFILGKKRD